MPAAMIRESKAAETRGQDSSGKAVKDFDEQWRVAFDNLARLKRLVETDVQGFSALKFANFMEAEVQLFKQMPQLRRVCQRARSLCQSHPRVSPHVAERVNRLQGDWLTVESYLSELKTHRDLLAALSGDLKLLESRSDLGIPSDNPSTPDGHFCCTMKIQHLDGVVQKKDCQLQQMISVTSAVRKLLDWVCRSELMTPGRQRSSADRSCASDSISRRRRQQLRAASAAPGRFSPVQAAAVAQLSTTTTSVLTTGHHYAGANHWQFVTSTGSTTYVRTASVTDGDQMDSSDSSEIIAQAQAGLSGSQIGSEGGATHNDNNSRQHMSDSSESVEESAAFGLSPLLRTVGRRVAALKSSTEAAQASLDSCDDVEGASGRLGRLAEAETALSEWQRELAGHRACILAAMADAESDPGADEEAIFRRAYLESLALLTCWTDSLRDRCKSKQLQLLQSRDEEGGSN